MGYLSESGFDRFSAGLKKILDKKAQSKDLDTANASIATVSQGLKTAQGDIKNLKYVTVDLPATGWSGSAPYTQTVSVSGMTADWVPGVPTAVLGSNVAVSALLAATEALGCIKMITSAAGTLTFTAPEDKPGTSLTLRVPGMVERS